jgi:hypothetical protein
MRDAIAELSKLAEHNAHAARQLEDSATAHDRDAIVARERAAMHRALAATHQQAMVVLQDKMAEAQRPAPQVDEPEITAPAPETVLAEAAEGRKGKR